MATNRERLNLRVDPDLKRRLDEAAADAGISTNAFSERALTVFLAHLITTNEEYLPS
jgi:predicted HicB family RNase H-like nuclease